MVEEWTKEDNIRYEAKKWLLDYHRMPIMRNETDLETRAKMLLDEIIKNE